MSLCSSDGDAIGLSFEALFSNDSYEEREFTFGQEQLRLLISPASSTDYDLTGQVLWPGAHLLASYLTGSSSSELPTVSAACELGAGLGLVSLLCSQRCPVTATDHSEKVLDVLQQNCKRNKCKHPVRCMRMDWGADDEVAAVKALSPGQEGFQLLLGADVCYNHNACPQLFRAVSQLLARSPSALLLLSYISRSKVVDMALLECAAAEGLSVEAAPGWSNIPTPGCVGTLYEIRWIISEEAASTAPM